MPSNVGEGIGYSLSSIVRCCISLPLLEYAGVLMWSAGAIGAGRCWRPARGRRVTSVSGACSRNGGRWGARSDVLNWLWRERVKRCELPGVFGDAVAAHPFAVIVYPTCHVTLLVTPPTFSDDSLVVVYVVLEARSPVVVLEAILIGRQ
jgi:hypothetical protein